MELYNKPYAYSEDRKPIYYVTNKLEIFNNYEFNRDLEIGHVKELQAKIKDFSICPILCRQEGSKLFVLDGQHRLEVAKRRNCEIYYRVIDMNSLDIAELQTKLNWSLINWAKYWNYQGKMHYDKLIDMVTKYKLSVSTVGTLLTSSRATAGGRIAISIRMGNFKITNEPFAINILNQLRDFPNSIRNKSTFIKAMIMINTSYQKGFDTYDHETMKKRISQYPEKFEKRSEIIDYMRMIEDIINIGLNVEKRYRFF